MSDVGPTLQAHVRAEIEGAERWNRRGSPRRRHGARLPRPRLGRALLVLALLAVLGLPVAGADTPPAQAPSFQGASIVDHGSAVAILGYVGWADVWTALGPNGSEIYSQSFYLNIFNLRDYPITLPVVAYQIGKGGNYSSVATTAEVAVPAETQVGVTVVLPPNPAWTPTEFQVANETLWVGPVATPVSFLPNYIANVGGLDLFALVLVSFMSVICASGFVLARWAMRRAIWAPSFRLLVWGHVFLALIAGAVFFNFQFIDQTFAGWAPLLYPWPLLPMFFLTGLSYFNRAPKVEVQRGVEDNNGSLAVERQIVRVGELADGRVVFVGESWGQFWARFWGHHAVCFDPRSGKAPPLFVPVVNKRSPTGSAWGRKKWRQKFKPSYPASPSRIFAFRVTNPQSDDVAYIAFGKTDEPFRPAWSRLSWHRTVVKPAKWAKAKDEEGLPYLVKTREERTVERLSLPHYVDFPQQSDPLEDYHYLLPVAVWYHFAGIRSLGRVVSKLRSEVAMLKAAFDNEVQDEVYTKLKTTYTLMERATSGLTETEARSYERDFERMTKEGGP